jgi:hypothetical protein
MCLILCAMLLVSCAMAAMAYTLTTNLSHDPHLKHKRSTALPKIGQHTLSRGLGHKHASPHPQATDPGQHGSVQEAVILGRNQDREGGTDSLAAEAAAAAGVGAGEGEESTGGGAMASQVQNLPGVALLRDARKCGPEMGEIHRCVREKRKNCGAGEYWQCLRHEGLHADAYTAVVSARDGLFLLNVNDMYIGASLMLYGEWSPQEVAVMGLNLAPDSTIVDVGANIGAMTVTPFAVELARFPLPYCYITVGANIGATTMTRACPPLPLSSPAFRYLTVTLPLPGTSRASRAPGASHRL